MTPKPMPAVTPVPLPDRGPEDVVLAADGTAYTASRDGARLMAVPPEGEARVVAELGGQALGCELLPDGRVLVCNASLGLQAVDPKTGAVESLLGELEGRPFGVCNNASVAPDGTIYVSESSRAHPLDRFRVDIIEDTGSGALWRWRPGGTPERLLGGLSFANGVALDPAGRFVLVAETARFRVHRVWLEGERAGEAEVFAEVPGFPDNLSVGDMPHEGGPLFWVALPAPPSPVAARVHGLPRPLRALIARLPEALGPKVDPCCRVAAYDGHGRLVHLFDGDTGAYHHVTGVRERAGTVWLASFEEPGLARFDLPSD